VMPSAMRPVSGGLGSLSAWQGRSILQVCGKHHDQRGYGAKREKGVERRQDGAQISRRATGERPCDGPGGKPEQGRYRPRAGRDLESPLTLRAHDVIGMRGHFGRRDFRFAVRTNANGHKPPPDGTPYNKRNHTTLKSPNRKSEIDATHSH
jgi:hypothetical protein